MKKRGPKVQAGKPVNLSGKRTELKLTLVSMLLLFAGLLRNGEARNHFYSAHNGNGYEWIIEEDKNMTLSEFITKLDDIAWGSVVLCLLVGVGIILSISTRFLQFRKFGHAMKNTLGKVFKKQTAGKGEVTPLQALTTALAATVGTGNIAGVTGAIVIGGPGAVFWMWLSALVGMCTKFAEVTLAVKYRERNDKGDWVGGPMYYIKNGLGKGFGWLSVLFCLFGFLAAFGIGNATQVQSIGEAIGSAINALGGNVQGTMISFLGNEFTLCNLIVGIVVAIIVALVLFGGIKRIGSVTEKIVPVMAVVYIISTLIVIFANIGHIGQVFGMIFKGEIGRAHV